MNIGTWADGFGRWHARVPVSGNQAADSRLAHAAIMWELAQRDRRVSPAMVGVKIDLAEEAREDTVVYMENS